MTPIVVHGQHGSRPRTPIWIMVLTLVALVGCSSDSGAKSPPKLPNPGVALGPEGAAFYQAPAPPAGAKPGDLV